MDVQNRELMMSSTCYLFCCNEYLVNMRRIYLPRYYVTYPSIVKMNGLLSFCNVEVYKRLSLFIKKIAGMF